MQRRDEPRRPPEGGGRGPARRVVGFALTILQRRLASSPEAIYQSLRRGGERLEARVAEERIAAGAEPVASRCLDARWRPDASHDLDDDFDVDDLPDGELEDLEDELVDQASAARTIAELEGEIGTLRGLERLAARCARGKGQEVGGAVRTCSGHTGDVRRGGGRRKLIIFTEHRDTLNYLVGSCADAARTRGGGGRPSTAACSARSAARPRKRSRRTRTCSCSSRPMRPARASTSSART